MNIQSGKIRDRRTRGASPRKLRGSPRIYPWGGMGVLWHGGKLRSSRCRISALRDRCSRSAASRSRAWRSSGRLRGRRRCVPATLIAASLVPGPGRLWLNARSRTSGRTPPPPAGPAKGAPELAETPPDFASLFSLFRAVLRCLLARRQVAPRPVPEPFPSPAQASPHRMRAVGTVQVGERMLTYHAPVPEVPPVDRTTDVRIGPSCWNCDRPGVTFCPIECLPSPSKKPLEAWRPARPQSIAEPAA